MKVLVADDDRITRLMLSTLLGEWGYDITEAADGNEALAVLTSADAPKLAILDWIMPGMNGIDVCREIRKKEEGRGAYLILLTMKRTERGDIVEGLDSGADDYMTKPFDPEELRARIHVGQRCIDLQQALAERVAELQQALAEVRQLSGLLPICSGCKKIRDDKGYWQQVESYVTKHTGVQFSHGLCPDCFTSVYPEFDLSELEKEES
ncbi:MAG: response regulator transcription factor [Lentisphaerae bacterium]|nr:response regulator transcription factor [Lentisphaerota bacterium]MBT4818329.1 response regulator transcription factor [Lentisphaerota bacterium]MBT5606045.1 response regulator transcription factor [Lentisphaerota bacterium]MBT7058566.1 response regulator transcription factor [Lentisphaerota bacterium]MBT7845484.1 response regulator transcription factor [Lentisphaerota bacterium]